ncbi:hypothetical protein J7E96_36595, partial [Streptomyces sp. ISL-96]|uniref:hypothetical protein n=1 Tax=Streptomyces sp. ISL-96 TaxID=2819191 RepID=UPI001BEBBA4A
MQVTTRFWRGRLADIPVAPLSPMSLGWSERKGPLKLAHLHARTVITPDRRVQLDLGHLRHDQDLHQEHPDGALAKGCPAS